MFELLSRRFDGEFVIDHADGTQSSAAFGGGLPKWCHSAIPGTSLGEVLVEMGAVESDIVEQAIAIEDGRRLAERLIGSFSVPAETIRSGMRVQCERRLGALCGAKEGSIRVVSGPPGQYPDFPDCAVLPIIRSGVMRSFDEERVATVLETLTDGALRPRAALTKYLERFRFTAQDQAAVQALADANEITFDAWVADADVAPPRARRLLCLLSLCRMVEAADTAADSTASSPSFGSTLVKPSEPSSASRLPSSSSSANRRRPADMPAGGIELARYLVDRWTDDSDPYAMLAVSDDADLAQITVRVHELREAIGSDETEQEDEAGSEARSGLEIGRAHV